MGTFGTEAALLGISLRSLPKPTVPVYSGDVADDVGDQPFQGGEGPDDNDHGAADDAFTSVVFDEAFIRAAEVHEPTAVERMWAAAQARAEAEAVSSHEDGYGYAPGVDGEPFDLDEDDHRRSDDDRYGDPYLDHVDRGYEFYAYGPPRPYRGHARWQRPVAWVLAVVMGVGVVALALTAVYRGAASQRQTPVPPKPPASTGPDGSLNGHSYISPGPGDAPAERAAAPVHRPV